VSCRDGDAEAQVQCVNILFLLLDGLDDPESKFRTLVNKNLFLVRSIFLFYAGSRAAGICLQPVAP
jgi:hypothetical protein